MQTEKQAATTPAGSGWRGVENVWLGLPGGLRILLVVLLALASVAYEQPDLPGHMTDLVKEMAGRLRDQVGVVFGGRPTRDMVEEWRAQTALPVPDDQVPSDVDRWTFQDGTEVGFDGRVLAPEDMLGTEPFWRLRAFLEVVTLEWVWDAAWWPTIRGSAYFVFVLPALWGGVPVYGLLVLLFLAAWSWGGVWDTTFLAAAMLAPLLSLFYRAIPRKDSGQSLSMDAFRRMRRDRLAMGCLTVVYVYAVVALLCSIGELARGEGDEVRVVRGTWVGTDWKRTEVRAGEYRAPSLWVNARVHLLKLFGSRQELRDYLGLGPIPSNEDLQAEIDAYMTAVRKREVEGYGSLPEITIPAGDYTRPGAGGLYPDERARIPGWFDYPFGTDFLGRDVFKRVIHGTRIAMSVGFVSCVIAIPLGTFFGALAGFYGGFIDEMIVLLYSTVASIPGLLLLLAFTMVVGKGLFGVYVALGMTSWVGICRLIRGEFIKHKEREYVLAARSLGASEFSCIFKHILPNVMHIMIINFSLRFVYAIQSEVILSYLGVGVQGQPSWGIMINDAKLELARGVWWQLAGATLAMFVIVLALNTFGDILRDALDPKLRE